MFNKQFMQWYVSFVTMILTLLIIGPAYYYLAKYSASFVGEAYGQIIALILGVFAVALAYGMMEMIESDKSQLIEEIEERVDRFLR